MADPPSKLSVLVDPPLAEPPPLAELRRRGKAQRRRMLATRGGLAAAVAAVVIGAGLALAPGDSPQTVQTAAPSPSTTAGAIPPALPATVPVKTFELDGQSWKLLATRTAAAEICFTLQPAAGEEIKPGCLTPDGRAVQAAAADLKSVSFVYGIVAPDVSVVTLLADGNGSRLDVLGSGSGFPVNFVGTVVPPSVTTVELSATRNRNEERVSVALPDHLRVSAVHGRDTPPAPASTTVATTRPPATQPPTTLAPDTPVSTAVPPATVVPGGGQPKRVQPVAGATDLRKQPFQSTASAGAQSLAVRFWSGVEPCAVLGRVDVAETVDKVTVTLWTGTGPGAAGTACIQIAAYYEAVVQLQAPLGGRTVVDGAA